MVTVILSNTNQPDKHTKGDSFKITTEGVLLVHCFDKAIAAYGPGQWRSAKTDEAGFADNT